MKTSLEATLKFPCTPFWHIKSLADLLAQKQQLSQNTLLTPQAQAERDELEKTRGQGHCLALTLIRRFLGGRPS